MPIHYIAICWNTVCIWYGSVMQCTVVCRSLNYDLTTPLGLNHTMIFLQSNPTWQKCNSVRVDPNAHPQHIKLLKHLCLHPIPEVLHSRHLEGGVPPGLCGGVGLGVTRRVADYSFWLWGSFIFANGLTPKPVFENWLKLPLNCYWCIVNEMIPTLLIVNIYKEIKSSIVIVNQISTPSYFWHSLGMQQV